MTKNPDNDDAFVAGVATIVGGFALAGVLWGIQTILTVGIEGAVSSNPESGMQFANLGVGILFLVLMIASIIFLIYFCIFTGRAVFALREHAEALRSD